MCFLKKLNLIQTCYLNYRSIWTQLQHTVENHTQFHIQHFNGLLPVSAFIEELKVAC